MTADGMVKFHVKGRCDIGKDFIQVRVLCINRDGFWRVAYCYYFYLLSYWNLMQILSILLCHGPKVLGPLCDAEFRHPCA